MAKLTVYTADGCHLREHFMYEHLIRIPLMIRVLKNSAVRRRSVSRISMSSTLT